MKTKKEVGYACKHRPHKNKVITINIFAQILYIDQPLGSFLPEGDLFFKE